MTTGSRPATAGDVDAAGPIERFTFAERIVHWVAGLSFVYLFVTGLALSHPRLFWLTAMSGGGTATRALHPWIGLVFSVSLAAMFFIWARGMGLGAEDRAWLGAIRAYATRDRGGVPPAGKYNAGQKLFFWGMCLLGGLHLLSGLPLWFPGGAVGITFGAAILNTMRLIHYVTTVFGGGLLIVHVYLGTVAYPGTLGAMLHGRVSRAWAHHHHPNWNPDEGS